MSKEIYEEYVAKFGSNPPYTMGMDSGEGYEALLRKAIDRGSPVAPDEFDAFLESQGPVDFDLGGLGGGIARGLENEG